MRVLALDCSSSVGWAVFKNPHSAPLFDTWCAPQPVTHASLGRTFDALDKQLSDLIAVHHPDLIAFEAPILPFGFKEETPRSDTFVIRLLVGMATIVDLVGYRHRKRVIEVPVPTAKVALAGTRWAKKRDMINAAVRRGWLVEDDHQADACAVGIAAYEHVGAISSSPRAQRQPFAADADRERR